ncbi:MAG: ABC transporter [Sandaracinus sp.]|nr:ABC transporter [Myxococcales bacterium]MAT28745.1 ABC transporter [Sandaracinus sp.]MBJ74711.1 ABC transporter [Sandaracinus sp.]
MKTLFRKEVRRFSKVWMQTVFSPLVTTSLYFLVFGVALGSRLREIDGVPYIEFVIPGLVMLGVINNAFLNCSSSLFQSKINGTVVDLLVAPIGPAEMLLAYVGAAVLRAFIVGSLVYLVASFFVGFQMAHPLWTLVFVLAVAATFATAGLITALWAEKFDHLSVVPNFVLTPLTFLGGVFYSVDMLPAPWDLVSRFNPILYMVNGLRHGLLGISDVPPEQSLAFVGGLLVLLLAVAARLLGSGYKLRS